MTEIETYNAFLEALIERQKLNDQLDRLETLIDKYHFDLENFRRIRYESD